MSYKVSLHGVRGSRPKHKLEMLGYGGNSTSIEFKVDEDFHLFLDGGSGLVKRGIELGKEPPKKEFHILITHTHWDHILGFPLFEPMYNPKNTFTFYASNTQKASFEELFKGLMNSNHLPVPSSQIKAKINFVEIKPGNEFKIGPNVKVKTLQLNHQGITLGYRVEYKGASAIVITDNAPIENGNYMGENMATLAKADPKQFEKQFDLGLIGFLDQADLVVFDTHFTEENLKPDWGHSTPQRALAFCDKARVKKLSLFHHAPEDSDSDVDAKLASICDEAVKKGVEVFASTEGHEWTLV